MPMVPSPFAAATYTALKLGGYAAFAVGLNRRLEHKVSPLAFGAVKTFFGLVGGFAYLIVLAPMVGALQDSSILLFLGALPIRLLVWGFTLHVFYDLQTHWRRLRWVAVAGTLWTYGLDGLMWLLNRILPGMWMPWC